MKYIPLKYQTDEFIWLTRKEAAECLGMSYEHFRRNWNAGKFKDLDEHPITRNISRDSIEKFLKEGVQKLHRRVAA